jgi:hypothetical protein
MSTPQNPKVDFDRDAMLEQAQQQTKRHIEPLHRHAVEEVEKQMVPEYHRKGGQR